MRLAVVVFFVSVSPSLSLSLSVYFISLYLSLSIYIYLIFISLSLYISVSSLQSPICTKRATLYYILTHTNTHTHIRILAHIWPPHAAVVVVVTLWDRSTHRHTHALAHTRSQTRARHTQLRANSAGGYFPGRLVSVFTPSAFSQEKCGSCDDPYDPLTLTSARSDLAGNEADSDVAAVAAADRGRGCRFSRRRTRRHHPRRTDLQHGRQSMLRRTQQTSGRSRPAFFLYRVPVRYRIIIITTTITWCNHKVGRRITRPLYVPIYIWYKYVL